MKKLSLTRFFTNKLIMETEVGDGGNVPQKMKKLVIKTRLISEFESIFKSTKSFKSFSINCNLENGLRVRNMPSFYNKFFFIFCGTLPSDPPNFILFTNRYKKTIY
jgi:hypothetical protein